MKSSSPGVTFRRIPRVVGTWLILCAVCALTLAGCNSPSGTITLWSDTPEMAAVTELFNAEHGDLTVTLRYTEQPADALLTQDELPDLVFGDYLTNKTILPLLRPVNDVLKAATESGNEFYDPLVALGRHRDSLRALPVCFDLPAVVFRNTPDNRAMPDVAMGIAALRDNGAEFNEINDGKARAMGFSPRWETEFLYLVARMEGAAFAEDEPRTPGWSAAELRQAGERLRNWSTQKNGGMHVEDAFEEQYLYDPPFQLVTGGRIRFWYMPASRYFLYTEGQRNELGFRWLSGTPATADDSAEDSEDAGDTTTSGGNGRIPVLEDVRFIGMPRNGGNNRAAKTFLRWFFTEDVQSRVLNELHKQRVHSFGLLGGFAAMPRVNTETFPKIYPCLLGRIPLPSRLAFPNALPKNWDAIREEVVEPWLYREVSGLRHDAPLDAQIDAWLLQKGE